MAYDDIHFDFFTFYFRWKVIKSDRRNIRRIVIDDRKVEIYDIWIAIKLRDDTYLLLLYIHKYLSLTFEYFVLLPIVIYFFLSSSLGNYFQSYQFKYILHRINIHTYKYIIWPLSHVYLSLLMIINHWITVLECSRVCGQRSIFSLSVFQRHHFRYTFCPAPLNNRRYWHANCPASGPLNKLL